MRFTTMAWKGRTECWWQRGAIVMHTSLSNSATARQCDRRATGWSSGLLRAAAVGKLFMSDNAQQQLLHLVIGGELTDLDHTTFKNLDEVDIVGVFPNYATAYAAWKAKAQQKVDNAHMRYFVVHLHRLLDPGQDAKPAR